MYVLKLGNNAITNDTKFMECDNCGSRFIYNECDVVTGVDVDHASVKYLMCPVCGKYIELERENDAFATAFSLIENIPPADVRPVVRGKWEWNEHYGLYECSNCHNSFVDEEWVKEGKWQYCPSCGACMENIHND